jgi:hypothetical protein
MGDLFAGVTEFLQGVIGVLESLLLPTDPATGAVDWTLLTGDPIKLMIWFALIFAFVPLVFNFMIRAIQAARGNGYTFAGGAAMDDDAAMIAADAAARPWKYSTKYRDEYGNPMEYSPDEDDDDYRAWIDRGDKAAFDRWAAVNRGRDAR